MERKRKLYWGEIVLFLTLLYGTTVSVFLNGDDFMYGTFAHQGILSPVWEYYHTGNGRFWINILDSALLWFDRYLFILVTPWIVLSFVWLMAKNLEMILGYEQNAEKHMSFMKIGMVLFACMDVMCLRETVYWITGMMNYLFPAMMFLLGYFWFQKSRNGMISGWKKILYFMLCFLAASSVEQYALMFVGMMTLYHGYDLIRKKKIPAYEWAAYLIALLGLAVLILAPGNFVRIDTQSEFQPSLVNNFWTLIVYDTLEDPPFPYYLMLNLLILSVIWKKKGYLKLLPIMYVVLLLLISAIPGLQKAIIFCGMYLVFVCIFVYMCIKHKLPLSTYALLFVGIGSQLMLLVSAIWGFRCMFSLYVVYIMLIMLLLEKEPRNMQIAILLSGITSSIHPAITLVYWTVSGLYGLIKHHVGGNVFKKSVIALCSVIALLSICIGYGSNVITYRNNLDATRSKVDPIVLKSLPNYDYSWYHMPLSDFHEDYYRQYYNLDDANILYDVSEDTE